MKQILLRLGMATLLVSLCWLQACGEQSEATRLAAARSSLEAKDTRSAVVQLKALLQQQPQSPEGRYLLGRALLQGDDPVAAVVELQKARVLRHVDDDVLPALAQALLRSGQLKAVTTGLADVQLSRPAAQSDLKASLAMAFAAQGQMDKADAALAAALQASPRDDRVRLMLARRNAGKGDAAQGLAMVDALLTEQPEQVQALLLKAELQVAGGRDDDALNTLARALAIEPTNVQAHTLTLQAQLRNADTAAFKTQVAKLAQAAPNSLEALFYQVQLALTEGNLQRAREGAQELLKKAPGHGPVLFLAGTVGLRTGDLEVANKHLTQAMTAMPDSPGPRRTLADAQLRAGQSEQALLTLAPLLVGAKPDVQALGLAADAHLQAGDLAGAQALYKRAAEANPADTRAHVALALARMARGDADGGLEELRTLAPADQSAFADMALISTLLQRNDVAAALQAIDALQAKQPGKPLPHVLRARLLLQQAKPTEALASLERALAADPLYFPAIAEITNLDFAQGRSDAARQRLEAFVAKDRQNVQAHLGLIELRRRIGAKPAEVEAALVAALKEFPADPNVRLALVGHHLEQRQARAALGIAQEAVVAMPGDPRLFDALGAAQLAMGDMQQATASFRKVIALRPNQPHSYLRLADVHAAAKDYGAAVQNLNGALDLAPSFLPAQRALVQLALEQRKPEEAMKVVRSVQKQRPHDAVGFLLEADVHLLSKAPAAAADALRAALEREPVTDTARRLHLLHLMTGRPAEAERFAAGWTQRHPGDADFIFHLGTTAAMRNEFANAEGHFRRSLTLLPDNARALNNVAMMLLRQNKPEARAFAERALAAAPDDPAVLDTMASVLTADNEPVKALALQRRAVTLAPEEAGYRLSLAKLLLAAGDKPQARTELAKLAALGGRFDGNVEVTALLKTL